MIALPSVRALRPDANVQDAGISMMADTAPPIGKVLLVTG
jgi:hypothetical protein